MDTLLSLILYFLQLKYVSDLVPELLAHTIVESIVLVVGLYVSVKILKLRVQYCEVTIGEIKKELTTFKEKFDKLLVKVVRIETKQEGD
jgi:hypothetical protein